MMRPRAAGRWVVILLTVVLTCSVAACELADRSGGRDNDPADPVQTRDAPALRPVDGGPDYYAQFEHGLPTSPEFFPVGVWLESLVSPEDVARDRAMGLNTYVEVTADSDPALARNLGMFTILSSGDKEANGYLVTDEPDMWASAGSDRWTGNYPGEGHICDPSTSRCGFTVVETLLRSAPPGYMTYANFGKGVAFWHSDAEAAQFLSLVDLVSLDTYWFTDPNICGRSEGGQGPGDGLRLPEDRCRVAANYGWTVERARSLIQPLGSKPVWHFVEVGHPAGESWTPTITGQQIRAAVWSGIIHGARGVIYFNHSFGGDCISHHVLRDACGDPVRADVTALNSQIHQLAAVLNAPFVDGLLMNPEGIDTAVKLHDGSLTILAGSTTDRARSVEFDLPCASVTTVQVLGEDRALPIVDGGFTDTFQDSNAVHIYRLQGETCGIG